jgi:hypothetical protein
MIAAGCIDNHILTRLGEFAMTIEEQLESHTPVVREIALRARALVLSIYPEAIEQIDPADHLIAYGHGMTMKELLWYIAPFKAHVNLGFIRGRELHEQNDPAGLLEGTGRNLRHVKLRSLADVDRPALRDLLVESLRQNS